MLADLPEEPVRGDRSGWRVRDEDPAWWLTRGANPDGSFCLFRGRTGRASVGSACGVVPFAVISGGAGEELVGVVVPDGFDRATLGAATVEVTHNVAIVPTDGSRQPAVTITGPGGTLQVTANLDQSADLRLPNLGLDGGRAATPEELAAVAEELTEPATAALTAARAAEGGDPVVTVVLRFGFPDDGGVCLGLVHNGLQGHAFR